MSTKKRVIERSYEDCEGDKICKSFPRFKVSSCPFVPPVQVEPTPVFIPVYGSLYTSISVVSLPGANVDFDTVGPSNGVTLDIVNNSITVNSSGIYTITFSTVVSAVGPPATLHVVVFGLSINGNSDPSKQATYQTETITFNQSTTLSRTDQLMLNAGDIVQIEIVAATIAGPVVYQDSALVVTKVA